MKALNDAYRKEKDPEKSTEIKDKMEPFYEEMGKITDRFIATHIDSYVTAGQLRYKVSSMTYPEAQAVFDRLSEWVKKSKLGQEVYQEIQKLKNGSPGSPAAIFSKKDIDGEMFSLADPQGKIRDYRFLGQLVCSLSEK